MVTALFPLSSLALEAALAAVTLLTKGGSPVTHCAMLGWTTERIVRTAWHTPERLAAVVELRAALRRIAGLGPQATAVEVDALRLVALEEGDARLVTRCDEAYTGGVHLAVRAAALACCTAELAYREVKLG